MSKKYYIELESLRSGKFYRDDHCSYFPTFERLKDAYSYSVKDYSNYYWNKHKQVKYHIVSEDKMEDYDPITKEEAVLCYNGDTGKY
jgi:hypothetical protein